MGCTYRPLGLAMGALLLASCAGQGVETADATQQQREAAEEPSSDAMVVTGSRIQVGNVEAKGEFSVGRVAAPPPPPPPHGSADALHPWHLVAAL